MNLWVLLPDEPIPDDRAYLIGYLQTVFDRITVSFLDRKAVAIPNPEPRPDLILNLLSAKRRETLEAIDAVAGRLGIPVSPPGDKAWRSEDKRSYIDDFPEAIPPTRIARNRVELADAFTEFGGDIVVKDPLNHAGDGVERVADASDLDLGEALLERDIGGLGEVIVQPYLSGFTVGDKRILLQRKANGGYKIIGHYLRVPPAGGWKSNIKSGGRILPADLTEAEAEFAQQVAGKAGLDNLSLDIGTHEGTIYLIETNMNYGGLVDVDLGNGSAFVHDCGAFLVHLAMTGHRE
ncbi:MAG: hypothetical protein OEN23_03980 [Paracoccaceae bacterium]|nr:hypothetical protein [Paracoccaceae bacterium]